MLLKYGKDQKKISRRVRCGKMQPDIVQQLDLTTIPETFKIISVTCSICLGDNQKYGDFGYSNSYGKGNFFLITMSLCTDY